MSQSFEELSARSRRGELSRAEQEQLRFYLNASLEARLWHEAGCQADTEDAVLPGDHDAAQRVMQRTLSTFAPARRRRVGAGVSMAAAAVFLVASVAAASVAGVRYFRERERSVQSPVGGASEQKAPARVRSAPAMAVPVVMSAAPAAPALSAAAAVEPTLPEGAPASSAAKPRAADASAAATLFGAAALARREGNAVKAIALLDSLQDQYPASREARLSDLTLGALHLKRGAAAVALRHFENYSRFSAQGALAPEAIWGQFQALSALGREAEARQRLRLLVERYPGSTYAGVARGKLNVESSRP